MNWSLFFDLTVSGLTLGSVYALIALGYSMVYGILKLLNFAHGDVYMIGAFIGWYALHGLGGPVSPALGAWVVTAFMFLAAMLGCGVLGVVIERFAYRPLRNAPRIAPLISALGVSFFLQNSALLLFGAMFRDYDSFDLIGSRTRHIGNLYFGTPQILTVSGAIVLMVVLTLVVARTQVGKAMRATSFDLEAASMMGIDVDRVIVVTFLIGSMLAGAAGVMNGLIFQNVDPRVGFQIGLIAFAAAVVGGIGSLPGAMLGGLAIGLGRAFSIGYISSAYQDVIVFAILIAFLLIRPSGIFGVPESKKV